MHGFKPHPFPFLCPDRPVKFSDRFLFFCMGFELKPWCRVVSIFVFYSQDTARVPGAGSPGDVDVDVDVCASASPLVVYDAPHDNYVITVSPTPSR